ncbi:MAG: 50S ribosomal protein L31 [Acholeplasmatales bacterium]|jgi:large subunit ribosomal protein L31|nr:50S ribosomal protein L31 [Acholeplasmatales bacterium]
MNKKVQPKYNVIKVKCSTCGHEFEFGTTVKDIKVDTCSNCHPFYTGHQTFTQAAGRVEKFNKKYGIDSNKRPE